jgi:hypothetical protein
MGIVGRGAWIVTLRSAEITLTLFQPLLLARVFQNAGEEAERAVDFR